MNNQYIDIFLCGGASRGNNISIRDQLRDRLQEREGVRVLYPEDLFIEMLKDKQYNLLELESFLADNSDVICIVCESAGSLVELGAFTSNEKTANKVIALIDVKRKKDKSFIMLGPVKVLKRYSKEKVMFYDMNELEKSLAKVGEMLNGRRSKAIIANRTNNKKAINTLVGFYYFIPLVLFFYNKISIERLMENLKLLLKNEGLEFENFDTLFRPSLKLLHKEKYIVKNTNNGNTLYSLTEKGYMEVNRLLGGLKIENKDKIYDHIRFDIMRNVYYNDKAASPR